MWNDQNCELFLRFWRGLRDLAFSWRFISGVHHFINHICRLKIVECALYKV